MANFRRTVLLSATILTFAAATNAAARAVPARNLYVFGGTQAVTGNDGWYYDAQIYDRFVANSTSRGWEYRWSNGPNWTERLGYHQGIVPGLDGLQDPWGGFQSTHKGYNFAHLGATWDGVYISTLRGQRGSNARSGLEQIRAYTTLLTNGSIKRRANDLFIVNFPNAVFTPNGDGSEFPRAALQALGELKLSAHERSNIITVGQVSASNRAQIFKGDTSELAGTPEINDFLDRQNNNTLNGIGSNLNLSAGARIHNIDPNGLIESIISTPGLYGIAPDKVRFTARISGTELTAMAGTCLANGETVATCDGSYLWWDNGLLSSRGHDIFAYYVASTLIGVYAWDQYRAVGAGSGAAGTAISRNVASASKWTGFAQNSLGLNQIELGKGAKLFSVGFDPESTLSGFRQPAGNKFQLVGSSFQLTPSLNAGATSFVDVSQDKLLDTRVRGGGATGFANLDLGSGIDLNILASSQNRTLNTNRPILFNYVGGIARAQTKVRLDLAQASLSRMFDIKGVKVGPVFGVASVKERWGETRESGVPEWLALNTPARRTQTTALNLGLAADWAHQDLSDATWRLSAMAGRIQADDWTPVALIAPSPTLADALKEERGSASFLTVSSSRESSRGWSFGLEAGIAQTEERQVKALRGQALFKF